MKPLATYCSSTVTKRKCSEPWASSDKKYRSERHPMGKRRPKEKEESKIPHFNPIGTKGWW